MLTDEEDIVLDIFGGSNTTGYAAEVLNRKWLTFEISHEYLLSSALRFLGGCTTETIKTTIQKLENAQANLALQNTCCDRNISKTNSIKDQGNSVNQTTLFL